MYSCNQCSKTFTRGDNLKRHVKFHCTDKISRNGCGILFTPASTGVVQKKKLDTIHGRVQMKTEIADGGESGSSSESEESMIDHIVADAELDESDMDADEDNNSESDEEKDVDEEDDYDDFWSFVYQTVDTKEYRQFLKLCTGYLSLYAKSKRDALFQNIMDDAVKFQVDGMKFEHAMAASILKHKKAIAVKVDKCKQSPGGEFEIWCMFAEEKVNPWCKFFTGEKCSCERCENMSMPIMVVWTIYLFHLIEEDDLALEISEKLEECQDLDGKDRSIVERYRKAILERYVIAKELSSQSDGEVKYSRMLVSMVNYINDNDIVVL